MGLDLSIKQLVLDDQVYKLILIDHQYHQKIGVDARYGLKLKPKIFKEAVAGIISFEKGIEAFFDAVHIWYEAFKKTVPNPRVPLTLVGFFVDTEVVTSLMGQKLAEELRMSYYETIDQNRLTIYFDITDIFGKGFD